MKRTIYITEKQAKKMGLPKKVRQNLIPYGDGEEIAGSYQLSSSEGDLGYAHVVGGDAGAICESKSPIEVYYRGYNKKYGPWRDHLFWLTDNPSYAKEYGDTVAEVLLDTRRLKDRDFEWYDDFDYYDGPSEQKASELLRDGVNYYSFSTYELDSEILCLWDKNAIVGFRELSQKEYDEIPSYDDIDESLFRSSNLITEGLDPNFDLMPYINSYNDFLVREGLPVKPFPELHLDNTDQRDIMIRTGFYRPDEKSITLFVKDRHPKDILRSYAHEMCHHIQNMEDPDRDWGSGKDLSEDDVLTEIESDAYKRGNILFRKWTEELKKHPDNRLNEGINWKERLKKLMKRRDPDGIERLKESVSNNLETWYRGYKASYGSDRTHLLWLTSDISYARAYGNRVEEVVVDMDKLNPGSLYDIDSVVGYEFDYYDGIDEEDAAKAMQEGIGGYEFEVAEDAGYSCLCLWDKSAIVSRRELSKEEFTEIEAIEGYDSPEYDDVIYEATESDVDLTSFKIKDELNPKIWKDGGKKIRPEVRLKLMDIADEFYDFLKISWVKVKDIIVVGSIANYNWSKFSDIDLHIVIDYNDIDKRKNFVEEYLTSKKKEWNSGHPGIKIYGYQVELYAQDEKKDAASSAVYSIKDDKWVKEPVKGEFKKKDINSNLVKRKAADIMTDIEKAEDEYKSGGEKSVFKKMDTLLGNVSKSRRESLASTKDELNIDNIVFKVLRRNGYLDKAFNLKDRAFDKIHSLG